MRFEVENFAPYLLEEFEVRIGETESFSPQLELATAEEYIVISAESSQSSLEPDRTQQSDRIDSVSIQNLPINRRNYLDLALLTPGVGGHQLHRRRPRFPHRPYAAVRTGHRRH